MPTRLLALARKIPRTAVHRRCAFYFEKPRTTVGWKGLLNDPHLDGSFAINDGLRIGRKLLLDTAEKGYRPQSNTSI